MEEPREVLSVQQRDTLFTRLREDREFREVLKRDWRAALKETGVDPEAVVDGQLTREEMQSIGNMRAAWTIIIVIFAKEMRERLQINEAVNFAARA